MLFFMNDYGEGAHPKILEAFNKANFEQLPGYGSDDYTISSRKRIASKCNVDPKNVFLLTGGTQTNTVVIDSLIKSYEGAIACKSGHINAHESGAVEAFGHKVIPVEGRLGKLEATSLDVFLNDTFTNPTMEHCVIPGIVYISFPTEYGTLYSKEELKNLYEVCHKYNLPLFIDGARLGYGLASSKNDASLEDIVKYSDVFYIGGTKVGALCGEAVVFTKDNIPNHFLNIVKRHGALMAKGRVLGIQFDTLFKDDLYFEISKNAIECAELLRNVLIEKGYKFFIDSPTNQLFPIVSKEKIDELRKKVMFEFWEKYDEENDVIRFVTSWATKLEDVKELIKLL